MRPTALSFINKAAISQGSGLELNLAKSKIPDTCRGQIITAIFIYTAAEKDRLNTRQKARGTAKSGCLHNLL